MRITAWTGALIYAATVLVGAAPKVFSQAPSFAEMEIARQLADQNARIRGLEHFQDAIGALKLDARITSIEKTLASTEETQNTTLRVAFSQLFLLAMWGLKELIGLKRQRESRTEKEKA